MIFSFRTFTGITAMLLLVLAALAPLQPAQAANERCFVETSYCISGPIRAYWERNGGLPVFGYPISVQQTETVEQSWTGPVQWFERDRLEDHSADGQGVLAGRLGDRALQLQGIDWQQLPGDTQIMPGCRFFRETQFNLCEPFLSYWERNGGLARFGYPLTRARPEVLEGGEYSVQYFERRRMERHPENAGTAYEILLGLLGTSVHASEPCTPQWFFSPAPKYCPLAPVALYEGAGERFEHGSIIWTRDPDRFYIFLDDGRYWIVSAPYTFVSAPPIEQTPPAGRYKPVSGFGDLWRGAIAVTNVPPPDAPLSTLLGWATEPEHLHTAEYQCHGGKTYAEQRCYMRGPDGGIVFFGPYGGGRWP